MANSKPVDKELLEILACPECKESLKETGEQLVCPNKHSWHVFDGLPSFLPDELLPKGIKEKGLKAFGRGGTGISWAAHHWSLLGIDKLVGKSEPEGKRVLLFGSGHAQERKLVEEAGYKVTAFDIHPMEGLDLMADGHKLPFKTDSFDLVTSFEVYEHLPRPWQATEEIARVTKPDGKIVGSVAFLKPFHESFFHMSFWGIRSLLESYDYEVYHLDGGQNPFTHIVGRITPLLNRKITVRVFNWWFKTIMGLRSRFWGMRKRQSPDMQLAKFDHQLKMSFRQFDRLKYSSTVVFAGRLKE